MSLEMRAVITIFNADQELRRKALPHVDITNERIDWNAIDSTDFGGGHRAAVRWARALWADQTPEGSDLFDRAFAMDGWLRAAVLKAIGIRWGIE